MGIGLVGAAESRSRTRADNVGGTSSTVSPAATSCWASNTPSPDAASMAHVRGVKLAAKRSSWSRCRQSALTCSSPITVSVRSRTAAVWELLWGVDPDDHEALLVAQPVVMPRRALLMRVDCSRLFRATPQREPDGRPLRTEANQQRRQGILETARRALGSYDHPQLRALRQPLGQYALVTPIGGASAAQSASPGPRVNTRSRIPARGRRRDRRVVAPACCFRAREVPRPRGAACPRSAPTPSGSPADHWAHTTGAPKSTGVPPQDRVLTTDINRSQWAWVTSPPTLRG
jgi:hypothetical protein